MRRWRVLLPGVLCLAGILVSLAPCGAQTPAPFGETQSGSIGAAGESDDWTFSASPGDVVLIRATRRNGNLWPRLEVNGDSANPMADETGIVMAEAIVTVPVGGAGSIRVRDGFDGTHTGDYGLFVQRLNDPLNAAPLEYGLNTDGLISTPGAMVTRALTAEAGDVIVARMTKRTDRLWPRIRVFTPTGALLADHHTAVTADLPDDPDQNIVAPVAGVYAVLLCDGFDGTFTGSFSLFAQRVNQPENAFSLDLGYLRADDIIDLPGVMRTYTVTLPDGYDTPLAIGMRKATGLLWPLLRLYGSDGTRIAEAEAPSEAVLTTAVPGGQTYTVVAGAGHNGTQTGLYGIGWQYSLPDVLRAMQTAAGFGEMAPEAWGRYNVHRAGDPEQVDLADAAWIARNAFGLQHFP